MSKKQQSSKNIRNNAASDLLKIDIEKSIKEVFISALEAVEIRFGSDFEGYQNIRAKILRVGNDAIRNLEELVDSKYSIERKSESIEFKINKGTVEYKGGKNV